MDESIAVSIARECGELREENRKLKAAQESSRSPECYAQAGEKVRELISGIRSINKSRHHQIEVPGDDYPCYWQRREWIEWILELADEAEKEIGA